MTEAPLTGTTARRLALVLASSVALLLSVSGCVSQGVADRVSQRLNHGMTTTELETARGVALDRARHEDARVTARAVVIPATPATASGAASGAATGSPAPCTTGRLLRITLAGSFPHARPRGSMTVSGQALTVDAPTGRLCSAHFLTGTILVDPQAALLFSS